jgi:peptide/nickel transport system ATP-binding protein
VNEPILTTRGLSAAAGEQLLLDSVDLELSPATVLAVVGESGSGKTTLGLALQGESRSGIALRGDVRLHGTGLLESTEVQRRRARAGKTAMVPQHPAAVLDPVRRIGRTLRELAALRHTKRAARDEAVRKALAAARLDPAPRLLRRFPHQLSGGQQQRLVLAQALITEPAVIILDEPTTGADTVTKSEIASTLDDLVNAGTALVLLTHDLPLARRLAHDVLVLRSGRVVEHGPGIRPLRTPAHECTREMLLAEPQLTPGDGGGKIRSPAVLHGEGLGKRARDGAPLLNDVNLTVRSSTCAAIVGSSGAGKTTLARCLAGLTRPETGRVFAGGVELAPLARHRPREHRRHVQYVHQDARGSFDPRRSVLDQIARTGELLREVPHQRCLQEAEGVVGMLGLDPSQVRRPPQELSGGQLQRAALARALLARPAVLICDEITSSLDVVNQAELVQLLTAIKSETGVGVVLISHDLAAVSALADEVHLLHEGRIVESATPQALLSDPRSHVGNTLVAAAREQHAGAQPGRTANSPAT